MYLNYHFCLPQYIKLVIVWTGRSWLGRFQEPQYVTDSYLLWATTAPQLKQAEFPVTYGFWFGAEHNVAQSSYHF